MKTKQNPDLPNTGDLHFVLLHQLYLKRKYEKNELRTADAYDVLGDYFKLTEEQRNCISDKGHNLWEARVRASYEILKKDGYVDSKERGVWFLTSSGIQLLEDSLLFNMNKI